MDTPDDTTGNTPGTTAAKRALRADIRARRAAVSPARRRERDARITAALTDVVSSGGDVAAFAGLPGEPGGPDLPEVLRTAGATVWLPVVTGPARPLFWRRYDGPGTTEPGTFGISEPRETPGCAPAITTPELFTRIRTLVIPALAVGSDGTRLGQGGGYYDRTLDGTLADPREPGTLVAVVDHEEFGVDVPRDSHDARVDLVVTDAGTFPVDSRHRDRM